MIDMKITCDHPFEAWTNLNPGTVGQFDKHHVTAGTTVEYVCHMISGNIRIRHNGKELIAPANAFPTLR